MARAAYLDMGNQRQGRAGWLEHQQEDSARHGATHDDGARGDSPDIPSALRYNVYKPAPSADAIRLMSNPVSSARV